MITKWCEDCYAYAELTCEGDCDLYLCEECAEKHEQTCPVCGERLKKFENM